MADTPQNGDTVNNALMMIIAEKFARFYEEWLEECSALDRIASIECKALEHEALDTCEDGEPPKTVDMQAAVDTQAKIDTQATVDTQATPDARTTFWTQAMVNSQAAEDANLSGTIDNEAAKDMAMSETIDNQAGKDAKTTKSFDSQADEKLVASVPDQLSGIELNALVIQTKLEAEGLKVKTRQVISRFLYHGRPDPGFTIWEQYTFSCAWKKYRNDFNDWRRLGLSEKIAARQRGSEPLGCIFGLIAEILPGRNYKDCIAYYYAYKSDGRFQDKALKHLKWNYKTNWRYDEGSVETTSGRVKVASQKARSLTSSDDGAALQSNKTRSPDARFVASLEKQMSDHDRREVRRILHDKRINYPEKKTHLPLPNIGGLDPALGLLFNRQPEHMQAWLRSAHVLPLIRQWLDDIVSNGSGLLLNQVLTTSSAPWSNRLNSLLGMQQDGSHTNDDVLPQLDQKLIEMCSMYVILISNGSQHGTIEELGVDGMDRCRLILNVLLWAFVESVCDPDGFFGILLDSPLAQLQNYQVRNRLEKLYVLPCDHQDGSDGVERRKPTLQEREELASKKRKNDSDDMLAKEPIPKKPKLKLLNSGEPASKKRKHDPDDMVTKEPTPRKQTLKLLNSRFSGDPPSAKKSKLKLLNSRFPGQPPITSENDAAPTSKRSIRQKITSGDAELGVAAPANEPEVSMEQVLSWRMQEPSLTYRQIVSKGRFKCTEDRLRRRLFDYKNEVEAREGTRPGGTIRKKKKLTTPDAGVSGQ